MGSARRPPPTKRTKATASKTPQAANSKKPKFGFAIKIPSNGQATATFTIMCVRLSDLTTKVQVTRANNKLDSPPKVNIRLLTLFKVDLSASSMGSSSTQQLKVSKDYFHTPCGLRNIGNTCFMNSVLQPVLISPYFTEYMLQQYPKEKKNRSTPVANSFYDLLQAVRRSGGSAVTPSDIKNQVSRTVSQFSGYGQ